MEIFHFSDLRIVPTNEPTASTQEIRPCQESRLLSLPAEIRNLIWKAVVGSEPVLLYAKSYRKGLRSPGVESLSAISLDPAYENRACLDLHFRQRPISLPKRRRKLRANGPLSWLRTCRQIYIEACPIVRDNLTLHICDCVVFFDYVSKSSQSIIRPQTLRSLSLCIRIGVDIDSHDGVSFTFRSTSGTCMWRKIPPHPRCVCPSPVCFARIRRIIPSSADSLCSLRELRLSVYFECNTILLGPRPIVGHHPDGRPIFGELRHPKGSGPLVWTDQPERIEELAGELCNRMPLLMFSREGKQLQSLEVKFDTKKVRHFLRLRYPDIPENCWCHGRSINEQSFPGNVLAKALEQRLKKNVVVTENS